MAELEPLRGIRYNPDLVKLGAVLAPPYDVIGADEQDALYGRNMRNAVRIELGKDYGDDVAGERDRYTRAREHLDSWLKLNVLVRDEQPSFYVNTHEFQDHNGVAQTRHGVLGLVAAEPWQRSQLRPHERTMSGPKQDRLALLRATRVQTSPVFVLAANAAGLLELLHDAAQPPALLGGRTEGDHGPEKHLLWRREDNEWHTHLAEALRGARLYVADGHHRYETMVTFAREQGQDTSVSSTAERVQCLVYIADATDPAVMILPTHRLVRPGAGVAFSLDDLWARLDDSFEVEQARSLMHAMDRIEALRVQHHAFAVVAADGVAVLRRERRGGASGREQLDVTVLEDEVLAPAGVGSEAIEAGALSYTRDTGELRSAVQHRDAVLGFGLNPVTPAELIAVADAGDTMPQKSTYFFPKVPTGLVFNPV